MSPKDVNVAVTRRPERIWKGDVAGVASFVVLTVIVSNSFTTIAGSEQKSQNYFMLTIKFHRTLTPSTTSLG
jgi:hypothetical protein